MQYIIQQKKLYVILTHFYNILHFLFFFPFFFGFNAARIAASNTSFIPICVNALHSQKAAAPMSSANLRPSSLETVSSKPPPCLRSALQPTRITGAFGQ